MAPLGYRLPAHKKLGLLDDLKLINLCLEIETIVHKRDINSLREKPLPLIKQEPLGEPFESILYSNLWEMYEE